VLVLTAIAAIAAIDTADNHRAAVTRPTNEDPLVDDWVAEPPHGDYIESVNMRGDGTVELVWGYGQLVRCQHWGRWARFRRDVVRFEYWDDDIGDIVERDLAFWIEHGRFSFVDHDSSEERHFGCRIVFDASPFPARCDTDRVYYGCAER
jgi:hypothetical protein